jgi:uncharacterized protein (DUF983 family)
MVKKGTKAYSILKSKCPHCHEGDFFEGSFFKAQVKERCDVCNERFSKEPGFYQGSYYVVYALGVAVFVTIWASIKLFFNFISFDATLIAIVAGLILSSPFTYPLSKTIWANFFFHYQQNAKEKITKIDS